jgi:hypothetical protein
MKLACGFFGSITQVPEPWTKKKKHCVDLEVEIFYFLFFIFYLFLGNTARLQATPVRDLVVMCYTCTWPCLMVAR